MGPAGAVAGVRGRVTDSVGGLSTWQCLAFGGGGPAGHCGWACTGIQRERIELSEGDGKRGRGGGGGELGSKDGLGWQG